MNRNQRRKQKSSARKASVPRVVAVHEAGHAIERYLTADLMGFPAENSIMSIDTTVVTPNMPDYTSGNGQQFSPAATTYGPKFSAEIEAIRKEIDGDIEPVDFGTLGYMKRVLAEARNRGADIESWLRARCVIAVSGPLAEAMASKVTFDDVWNSEECRSDMRDLVFDCTIAGVEPEDIQGHEDDACEWMIKKITQQEICNALNDVAARIQKPGKIPGKTIAAIIRRAIDGKV